MLQRGGDHGAVTDGTGAAFGRDPATQSHLGAIAVPAAWAYGHHLGPHRAAELTDSVLFAGRSSVLTKAGRRALKLLLGSLTGDKTITCEGYSDYAGTTRRATELSLARARTVCNALAALGAKTRTRAVGYGPTRPVVIGGHPADRAANQRVIIYVEN